MKRIALALAVTALAALLPAQAEQQPASKAPAAKSSGRLVCFTEPVTGSHMRKRVCMTEEERAQRRAEDQEAARRFKNSSSSRSKANVDPEL
jgi:hypothetical protein